MRTYLRQVWAIVRKDVLQELRTRQRLATMGSFAVLVAVLFNYSVDPTVVRIQEIAAGLLWMTLIFTGVMGVGRTFQLEAEDGAFDGILLSPIPRDAVYLAKVLSNTLIVGAVTLLTLGAFGLFFQLDYGTHPFALGLVLLLGGLGFVALATLFGAVAAATRLGDTLLPVLLFPLLVPVVIFGVGATARLLMARPLVEVEGQIRMLGAFATAAVALGAVLFRFVVED
jgi:heme exporter protein B